MTNIFKQISNRRNSNNKFLLVLIVFAIVRIVGLGQLPPFADENLNILTSFSDSFRNEVSPESLGRVLLSYQFYLPAWVEKYFVGNVTVLSSRMFVVTLSMMSLILWYNNIAAMYDRTSAVYFCLLIALNPYFWIHDRLALQDSFFGFIWGLLIYLALSANACAQRLTKYFYVFLCGCCIGLGYLNKITGVLSLPWIIALIYLKTSLFDRKQIGYIVIFLSLGFFLVTLASIDEYLSYGQSVSKFKHLPVLSPELFFSNSFKSLLSFIDYIILYSGYTFLILIMLAIFFRSSTNNETLYSAALSFSIFSEILIYSSRSYGRYYYSEIIALTILVVSLNVTSMELTQRINKARWTISFALLILAVVWLTSWVKYVQDPTNNSFTDVSKLYRSSDYKNYANSWVSGQGTEALSQTIDIYKKDFDSLVIFVYSHSVAGSRSLSLKYLDDPVVKVVQIPFYTDLEFENLGYYLFRKTEKKVAYLFLHETIADTNVDIDARYTNIGITLKNVKEIKSSNGNLYRLYSLDSFNETTFLNSFEENDLITSDALKPNSIVKIPCDSAMVTLDFGESDNIISLYRANFNVQKFDLSKSPTVILRDVKKDDTITIHSRFWNLVLEQDNSRTGYFNIYRASYGRAPHVHGLSCSGVK